jgi:hypothetical protein
MCTKKDFLVFTVWAFLALLALALAMLILSFLSLFALPFRFFLLPVSQLSVSLDVLRTPGLCG